MAREAAPWRSLNVGGLTMESLLNLSFVR